MTAGVETWADWPLGVTVDAMQDEICTERAREYCETVCVRDEFTRHTPFNWLLSRTQERT